MTQIYLRVMKLSCPEKISSNIGPQSPKLILNDVLLSRTMCHVIYSEGNGAKSGLKIKVRLTKEK